MQNFYAFLHIRSRTFAARFPGQHQKMAEACGGDCGRFLSDLFRRQSFSRKIINGAEAAIGAVIHTEISQIHRCEQLHHMPEMRTGQPLRTLGHLLQTRLRSRRQQGLQIPFIQTVLAECPLHILHLKLLPQSLVRKLLQTSQRFKKTHVAPSFQLECESLQKSGQR
ncbi:hypothetical protein D3C75_774330 [compost metagenome]